MPEARMRLFAADIGEAHARRASAACERIGSGDTWDVVRLEGPACVCALRFAGPWQTPGLVLRCLWDGEEAPSVEVPLAAFLGGGQRVASALLSATPGGPAEVRVPMPFARGARLEIVNLGDAVELASPLRVQVDYEVVRPEDARQPPVTFHAQWFRTPDSPPGRPLQACRATGHGAYLGCLVSPGPGTEGPLAAVRDLVWVDGEGRAQALGTETLPVAEEAGAAGQAIWPGPFEGLTPEGPEAGAYRFESDRPLAFRSSLWVCLPGQPAGATAVGLWHQHEPHREALAPLAPEHLADPRAPSREQPPRAQERVEWLVGEGDHKVVSHNHLLDLSALAGGGSPVVLQATLTCAETRSAHLYLSYEGLVRVLFDGALLFERERSGGFGLDPIAMMIPAGQHTVQLELTQGMLTCGAWLVGFRVANSEGRTQQDVSFAEHPGVPEV